MRFDGSIFNDVDIMLKQTYIQASDYLEHFLLVFNIIEITRKFINEENHNVNHNVI